MRICLVNTNRIKPPIAPIGLDYVAEALNASGHHVEVLDLCWADDPSSEIAGFFDKKSFGLVGITLRNTDDCAYATRQSFLGEFADMVNTVRKHTDAVIVLGGVGFSIMPEQVLGLCRADAGIKGEGEFALAQLAERMERKKQWIDIPGLIWSEDGRWYHNIPANSLPLPLMSRSWVDNRRYFNEGGQIGIETKRGCSGRCIYCADPIAKGRNVRTRSPKDVVYELERLLDLGIDCFHICDSEFNMPEWHAVEVCREIIRRDIKPRWYAYCSPVPFSRELAYLMHRAGCAGINFGVDSGDEMMLKRLKRDFTRKDIMNAARWCREAGISVMFDLLLGSPGETEDSLIRTIEFMRQVEPDRAGVSAGIRVYPGTELADMVMQKEKGLTGGKGIDPFFFIEPEVAPFIFHMLDDIIGNDRRFFFFDPARPDRNYNYSANQVLIEAIHKGYRGAYWDILRRIGDDPHSFGK